MTGALIGYARARAGDPCLEAQADKLTAAACSRVFVDTAAGKDARPAWSHCRGFLRQGDTLVITRIDRLGRSVKSLIEIVQWLGEHGVGLRVLDQDLDTSTPEGRRVVQMFAVMADYEQALAAERKSDGVQEPTPGARVGRPLSLSLAQIRRAQQLYRDKRLSVAEIATYLGCSVETLYRHLSTDTRQATA